MKIASWNVNGIRAVHRKGDLNSFLKKYSPDVLFLQETKANKEQVQQEIGEHPEYEEHFHSADRPGYAGTALWIRKTAFEKDEWKISQSMPGFNDTEGRIIRGDFHDWSFLGIYFPNGGKSHEAWLEKLKFYEKFLTYIQDLRDGGRKVLFCGDINCAHEEKDLARPKENKKSIGFLPEERAWMTKVISSGFADVFRFLHPNEIKYSWWSPFAGARQRNIGWRIDYFFIDQKLIPYIVDMEYINDQKGSDHCPVMIEIKKNFVV